MKKEFDSVSHQSMLNACQKAGLPEPFINYLDNLYKAGETQLQANGHLSNRIRCNQGVKQGDPLSPTLFNYVCSEAERDPGDLPSAGVGETKSQAAQRA